MKLAVIGVPNDDVVFAGVELEPFEKLGRVAELVRGTSTVSSNHCLCPHC